MTTTPPLPLDEAQLSAFALQSMARMMHADDAIHVERVLDELERLRGIEQRARKEYGSDGSNPAAVGAARYILGDV